MIRKAIFEVLATIAPEIEPDAVRPDKNLREQVDLDSMDFLNFVVGLHDRLQVEIPEADYAKLTTLEKIVSYLAARISGRQAGDMRR